MCASALALDPVIRIVVPLRPAIQLFRTEDAPCKIVPLSSQLLSRTAPPFAMLTMIDGRDIYQQALSHRFVRTICFPPELNFIVSPSNVTSRVSWFGGCRTTSGYVPSDSFDPNVQVSPPPMSSTEPLA